VNGAQYFAGPARRGPGLVADEADVNIMTLGGLALAVGVLVDEATVTIENIHTHLARGQPIALAAFDATVETALPRLLAMLSVVAVFHSGILHGRGRKALFVPLSLAVGFSMFASYVLSTDVGSRVATWLFLRTNNTKPISRGHSRSFNLPMPV